MTTPATNNRATCKGDNCTEALTKQNRCDDYPDMCLWCCNCIGSDGYNKH
jgi:hypothetical protein